METERTNQNINSEPIPDEGRLIERAWPVLYNPLIALVVDKHDSVTATENYFAQKHRWPNEVLKCIKAAAQLRQRYPKAWHRFSHGDTRPADVLFDFGEEEPGMPGVRFATTMKFGPHRVDLTEWPVLLRDFSIETDGGRLTSCDGKGDALFGRENKYNSWPSFTLMRDAKVQVSTDTVTLRQVNSEEVTHPPVDSPNPNVIAQWVLSPTSEMYWQIGPYRVATEWAWYTAENGSFHIYRQILIQEDVPQDQKSNPTWSEVLIRIPAFHDAVQETTLGSLTFRRTIRQSGYDVTLELSYSVSAFGFGLHPEKVGSFITLRNQRDSTDRCLYTGHGVDPDKQGAAFSVQAALYNQIMKQAKQTIVKRDGLTVEDIAGLTFLQNPPTQLSDLFTQPKTA